MAATTIFEAAKVGDDRLIRKWLDTEGDVNRKDDHDFTALHWATRFNKTEIINLLLEHAAAPNEVNCSRDTPLHYSAAEGNLEAVKKLIAAGAIPTVVNDHGNTPLHYACFWRHQDVAEFLMENGALVAAANKYGKTPLHRAGEKLSATLKEKALALGQSLHAVQAQVRSAEEAAGIAKAKFMAQAGVSLEINNSALKYEDLLMPSSNSNCEVFRGQWTNYTVVIKKLAQTDKVTPEITAKLTADVDALRKLFHANLLPILAVVAKVPDVALVTELQTIGSLSQLLHDVNFNMDQRQAIKFALEVSRAIAYLHEQNMPHFDVRTTNVLVGEDLTIKVTDYGLRELFNSSLRQEKVFEPQWIAPEALKEKDTTIADMRPCDVYSFGMVLFEIVTRQLPFEGLNAMQIGMKICLEGARPTIPDFVPRHLSQLLTLCWQEEPARRPRMAQILAILEKL